MRHSGWLWHQLSSSAKQRINTDPTCADYLEAGAEKGNLSFKPLSDKSEMLPRPRWTCLYRHFHLMTISMKGDGLNNNSSNVESFIELCLYDCAHTLQKYYANTTLRSWWNLYLSLKTNWLVNCHTHLAEESADKLVYLQARFMPVILFL